MTSQSPTINDRPDQAGQIAMEQSKQAKQNAIVMNKMLTKIDQGKDALQTDEYKIAVKQKPKRVFPFSNVMEATLDDTFHAKMKIFLRLRPKGLGNKGHTLIRGIKKSRKQSTRTSCPG